MSSLETFRRDAREWLEANCPAEMRRPMTRAFDAPWGGRRPSFDSDAQRLWFERMVAKRWTCPGWPVEYGGAGLTPEEVTVLGEELRRIGARPPLLSSGIWMLGPTLLRYGSEAQRRTHLPPIARGEIRWCQGYSEPGAGSDLASLRTRAEDRGSHWRVNGQKIWTSYAAESDWMFCLVRTDPDAPKHRGIGFLMIDMQTPGITVRPIRLISGHSDFCETFFVDVDVPRENLVGAPGQGWEIARFLMTHEREMIGNAEFDGGTPPPGELGRRLAAAGVGAADAPLRAEIARHEIDAIAVDLTARRFAAEAAANRAVPVAASVQKYVGSEVEMRRKDLLVSIAGSEGLRFDDIHGELARDWLRSRSSAIAGGTTEIQLNLIARHLLGS